MNNYVYKLEEGGGGRIVGSTFRRKGGFEPRFEIDNSTNDIYHVRIKLRGDRPDVNTNNKGNNYGGNNEKNNL